MQARAAQHPAGPAGGGDRTSQYLRKVYQLVPKEFRDLYCRVLAIDRRRQRHVYFVWDGTDAKPVPPMETTLQDAAGILSRHEMPRRAEEGVELLAEVPGLGSAIPLVDTRDRLREGGPRLGQWIKLKNVGTAAVEGQLQLAYSDHSHYSVVNPDSDATAREIRDFYRNTLEPARMVAGHAPAQAQVTCRDDPARQP